MCGAVVTSRPRGSGRRAWHRDGRTAGSGRPVGPSSWLRGGKMTGLLRSKEPLRQRLPLVAARSAEPFAGCTHIPSPQSRVLPPDPTASRTSLTSCVEPNTTGSAGAGKTVIQKTGEPVAVHPVVAGLAQRCGPVCVVALRAPGVVDQRCGCARGRARLHASDRADAHSPCSSRRIPVEHASGRELQQ